MRHPVLLREHVEGAAPPRRPSSFALEALEFVVGLALLGLLAFTVVDAIGHVLGWAWWMAEHWKDAPP